MREPTRSRNDVVRFHTADFGGDSGRSLAHDRAQCIKILRVRGNVLAINPLLPQHYVQHGVEQRHVGARQDGQMQVGKCRGLSAARIDDDDFQIGVSFARGLDAAEQNGMRERRIRSGDKQARRMIQVFITAGRRIHAQRLLVAGHGRRHAQARVGIDVIGTDQALGELVEDVVVLGKQLSRDIEADTVRAVFTDGGSKAIGEMVESFIPGASCARQVSRCTQLRVTGATGQRRGRHGERKGRALGAKLAEVGRMIGIAVDVDDLVIIRFDDDAAAGAAVAAGGFGLDGGHDFQGASLAAALLRRARHLCQFPRPRIQLHLPLTDPRHEFLDLPHIRQRRAAVVQADAPVVQRARHRFAEHDALRQRPAFVRALVL